MTDTQCVVVQILLELVCILVDRRCGCEHDHVCLSLSPSYNRSASRDADILCKTDGQIILSLCWCEFLMWNFNMWHPPSFHPDDSPFPSIRVMPYPVIPHLKLAPFDG